jgi:hypothetical protein
MTLETELVWNPRAHSNVRHRGALVGTLYGIPVTGKDTGRSVAYQLVTTLGKVFTVYWDGTVGGQRAPYMTASRSPFGIYPYLYDVDTDKQVLINPAFVASFAKLADVAADMPVDSADYLQWVIDGHNA